MTQTLASPVDATAPPAHSFARTGRFVPISLPWRLALIVYLLLYSVFLPGLREIVATSPTPLFGWRFLTSTIYALLLFLPILFYRREYGWLHPLIFPTVWQIARDLITNPDRLITPLFLVGSPSEHRLRHVALAGWSEYEVALAMIEADLIAILALVSYYLAFFFAPAWPPARLRIGTARNVAMKAFVMVAFSVLVFAAFMQARGGLVSHLVSFGQGRFRALEGTGPIIVLIGVGTVAALIWYALDRKATRNPVFWIAVPFCVLSGFATTGSRSSILFAIALFGMIWMLRHQRAPALRAFAIAGAALVAFGILGALRESTWEGELDTTVITDFSFERSVNRARREADQRASMAAHVAVVAKVPEQVPLLMGRTYLAAVFFFVPRRLWEDKPRGAGPMTSAYIFGSQEFGSSALRGAGIPPGEVAEVYWNFYIPGVVVVFLLYGMFHRWVVRTYIAYDGAPAVAVLYVLTVLVLSLSTIAIVDFLQMVVPALLILRWTGAIRFGRTPVAGIG